MSEVPGRALPKRGEVWLADITGDKIRPVVIMTRSAVIPHLHSVIAAPVTSTIRAIPSEVPLGAVEGLLLDSVANFDNIQLIDRQFLIVAIGSLGTAKLSAACAALAHATACAT